MKTFMDCPHKKKGRCKACEKRVNEQWKKPWIERLPDYPATGFMDLSEFSIYLARILGDYGQKINELINAYNNE